jgi:hypothetical protein
MGITYLENILHKILIYLKYTLFNVTIITRSFMLIMILEYTFNMIAHIKSKYTLIYCNTPNHIVYNSKNTPLYTHEIITKLVTFTTNETKIVLLG